MFSNYYNDPFQSPSSVWRSSPSYGQQQYLSPSQREYLRRQQQQEAMAQRQLKATQKEQRRRERMLEEQRQEEQRQRILARMEEKKRAHQLAQQRQRQMNKQTVPTNGSSDEKYVVVRGPDGNMYRVPSSMIRGRPEPTPKWVRKVSADEADKYEDARESMSVSSNESEYEMASQEEDEVRPQMNPNKSHQAKTRRQTSLSIGVVEDASDSESEDDVTRDAKPYVPGPGESWMEPVQ